MQRIRTESRYEREIGYARAVVCDGWVFVAGTCAKPGPDGKPPEGVIAQCNSALEIIGTALTEAGATFADVVRVTYMLPDRGEFAQCWPILKGVFGDHPPAGTMIECGLLDPLDRIEIEVTARLPTGRA